MDDAASLSKRWIDLTGKVALVTGAASGIGRAAALALGGAGAVVIALDRDAEGATRVAEAIDRDGGEAYARALDVTSEAQWSETKRWVRETRGAIDILINSAGVALSDRVGDTDLGVYQRTFAVNVEGTLLGMATALDFMREARKGVIVNLSSTASLQSGPIMASYGASKAAISHYTRSAAKETLRAGHDIRINAILPGLIDTAMADDLHAVFNHLGPRDSFVKMITTGRAGRPEEVADLILFLVSDRASFISGACIVIDRAASA